MKGFLSLFVAFGAVLYALPASEALAAADATTVVTVKSLCPNCGKKIVGRLKMVPSVSAVEMDVARKTFTIHAGANISPKTVWETVEAGGELPVKLEGPGGTFTAKPK